MPTDPTGAAARIDSLLDAFAGDPALAAKADDLVRAVMDVYEDGLGRLVGMLDAPTLAAVAADEVVAGLLVLHDLHPVGTYERVSAALDRVRPYLGSHSGDVELLGVDDDGVVRLRLAGSCDGCPSSAVTVKVAIERAIEAAAPEVTRVDVEGVVESPREIGGRTLLPLLSSAGPA